MQGIANPRSKLAQSYFFYQNRYQELLEELASKGWEALYLSRFNI